MNQMSSRLSLLHLFGQRLQSILRLVQSNFTISKNTQKLLGYKVTKENPSEATLLLSSPINPRLALNAPSGVGAIIRKTSHGENVISIEDAGRISREILTQEFRRIIETHCAVAQSAGAFQPLCIRNVATKCQRPECKYLHVPAERMKEVVNQRFVLFLHQIMVINNMDFIMGRAKYQLRRYAYSCS